MINLDYTLKFTCALSHIISSIAYFKIEKDYVKEMEKIGLVGKESGIDF